MVIRDFWDNIKHMNIHIIDVPEGGEREKGQRNYLNRAENFPNLGVKKTDVQDQGAQRVTTRSTQTDLYQDAL